MQQAHGIGYAEYGRSFEKRMKIEKKRENDYNKGLQMIKEHDHKLTP